MGDLSWAIAHHLAVFSLVAMVAAEAGTLRSERFDLRQLARLDAGYGAASIAVLAIGAGRVVWGAKGWAFYSVNPWFWTKMGAFALIGLASIPPTLAFARWRRAAKADPNARPDAEVLARARGWVRVELALVLVTVGAAATMARWPF